MEEVEVRWARRSEPHCVEERFSASLYTPDTSVPDLVQTLTLRNTNDSSPLLLLLLLLTTTTTTTTYTSTTTTTNPLHALSPHHVFLPP
ncbi:hypothetical protein E2C01_066562 [Portunus trituberculatus]|uniref:Uncharacterized protein n=1 Tax=Portunus trituberculatus TaxID=210409 RepID=A0A5B7HV07_PORTR|nr:hypothetical protein [Portunus trituberculatus]